MNLCNYGCGQPATHQFKNGKWCCSSNVKKCPGVIKKWKKAYKNRQNTSFKKITCQYCKKEFSVANIKLHEKSCYLNPIHLKLCPTCGEPIKNKNNTFCSVTCTNYDRVHLPETKQKISNSIKLAYKQGKFKNKGLLYISKERREEINKEARDRYKNKFDSLSWDDLPLSQKRKRVLTEQNYKCLCCGIKEWNGKDITLHFDHINGDKTNNERENVRYLCPNCHSQTPTYCGNKQKLPQYEHLKITKERLSTIA